MNTFNIIYSATDVEEFLASLAVADVRVVEHYRSLSAATVKTPLSKTKLKALPGVTDVELDKAIEIVNTWHQLRIVSPSIPMEPSYHPMYKGDGVVVYLVDGGVNASLDEFSEATIVGLNYDLAEETGMGHGSVMASLIVGKTHGVSPNAVLKSVRIPSGATNISTLLAAFDAILADCEGDENDVRVVNCSWNIPKSLILDTKIQELQANNLFVVAAAGNTKTAADDISPAGLDTVIGVGASDAFDCVVDWSEGAGSNWGPEVDIFAPGVDLEVLGLELSGTSPAAAITSGVVAQLIQEFPEKTAEEIQAELIAQADLDVLIRDESVYETTPNRLLKTKYMGYTNAFITPQSTRVLVMTGTAGYLDVEGAAHMDMSTLTMGPYKPKNKTYTCPPWVRLEGNTVVCEPGLDVTPGLYLGIVTANDADGVQRALLFSIGVYEVVEWEITEGEPEGYHSTVENGEVVVRYTVCPIDNCTKNLDVTQCGKEGFDCGCTWPPDMPCEEVGV